MRFAFLIVLLFASNILWAACPTISGTTLPVGDVGEVQMSIGSQGTLNKLMFCDGTSWTDFGGSPTATACAKNGEILLQSGEAYYCNKSKLWRFDSGSATNGACSKSGEIRVNAGTIEFCSGSQWRVVSTDTTEDAMASAGLGNLGWGDYIGMNFQARGYQGTKTATFDFSGMTAGCAYPKARICGDTSCYYSGGTVLSERSTNGTLDVPNGAFIYLFMSSAQTGSTSCSIQVTLGSQNFSFTATTAPTDEHPTFSFLVNLRSQPTSTTVVSNIQKIYNFSSGTVLIDDNGTGGSPEFRICADATCTTVVQPWGSASQTIYQDQYFQARTTTGATNTSLRQVRYKIGTQPYYSWFVMTSTCPETTSLLATQSLSCTCPANYLNYGGSVYGTGSYSQASDICRAAIHSGAVTNASGGSVTPTGNTLVSCPSFTGSTANGVTSSSSGLAANTMFFPGFGTDACN